MTCLVTRTAVIRALFSIVRIHAISKPAARKFGDFGRNCQCLTKHNGFLLSKNTHFVSSKRAKAVCDVHFINFEIGITPFLDFTLNVQIPVATMNFALVQLRELHWTHHRVVSERHILTVFTHTRCWHSIWSILAAPQRRHRS